MRVYEGEEIERYPGNPERKQQYILFVWTKKTDDGDLVITTYNNPITGKHTEINSRENKKDYASYIKLRGPLFLVEQADYLIEQNAEYIKSEEEDNDY